MKIMKKQADTNTETNVEPLFVKPQRVLSKAKNAATLSTNAIQRVHCPTCGSAAERYQVDGSNNIRTECSHCDYLMVYCSETGRVIESYAPSFSPAQLSTHLAR